MEFESIPTAERAAQVFGDLTLSIWSSSDALVKAAAAAAPASGEAAAFKEAVDKMGVASGVAQVRTLCSYTTQPLLLTRLGAAQGLSLPITSAEKLAGAESHRLYLLRDGAAVQGLLKVGVKHLYYWKKDGSTVELDPLCVLDIYVHESAQRRGVGKALFDAMLEREGLPPHKYAYDRPSAKMMPFLAKHFGLTAHNPQPNKFVVFDRFFDEA